MGVTPRRHMTREDNCDEEDLESLRAHFFLIAKSRGWLSPPVVACCHLLQDVDLEDHKTFLPLHNGDEKNAAILEDDGQEIEGDEEQEGDEADGNCASDNEDEHGKDELTIRRRLSSSSRSPNRSDSDDSNVEREDFFLGSPAPTPAAKRRRKAVTPKTPIAVVGGIFSTPGVLCSPPGKGRRTPKTNRKDVGLASRRQFLQQREAHARTLYALFNEKVFKSRLPASLEVSWSKRLLSTAGITCNSQRGSVRLSRIELSTKVLDSYDKLRQTLAHEMCHVAAWLIHAAKEHHGRVFQHWGRQCQLAFPDLKVTRCHNYDIFYKYRYTCQTCSKEYGRHSSSIDTDTARCGLCKGLLVLTTYKPDGTPCQKRAATPFAVYVKENYAKFKADNSKTPHKLVMGKLAEQFKAMRTPSH